MTQRHTHVKEARFTVLDLCTRKTMLWNGKVSFVFFMKYGICKWLKETGHDFALWLWTYELWVPWLCYTGDSQYFMRMTVMWLCFCSCKKLWRTLTSTQRLHHLKVVWHRKQNLCKKIMLLWFLERLHCGIIQSSFAIAQATCTIPIRDNKGSIFSLSSICCFILGCLKIICV